MQQHRHGNRGEAVMKRNNVSHGTHKERKHTDIAGSQAVCSVFQSVRLHRLLRHDSEALLTVTKGAFLSTCNRQVSFRGAPRQFSLRQDYPSIAEDE
jgi:hypothetical protein